MKVNQSYAKKKVPWLRRLLRRPEIDGTEAYLNIELI
jgi:hypothetical protein